MDDEDLIQAGRGCGKTRHQMASLGFEEYEDSDEHPCPHCGKPPVFRVEHGEPANYFIWCGTEGCNRVSGGDRTGKMLSRARLSGIWQNLIKAG
jgi:hypothetical protein